MRSALFVLLLLLCGCIGGESPQQPKPDDGRMDSLFSGLINESAGPASTQGPPPTAPKASTTLPPAVSATYTETTRTTVSSVSTSTVVPEFDCAHVPHPLGPLDCNKGYCTLSGMRCRYLPGSINTGYGKCVCVNKN
jgi:hypothetical protein